MKFSRLFTGKPYHEIEKKADALLKNGEYGFANLEYEKALLKLAKTAPETPGAKDHIEAKIVKCKDALALEHQEAAKNLTEAGLYEEAEDLLQLALELVQNEQITLEIEEQLKGLKAHSNSHDASGMSVSGKILKTQENSYTRSPERNISPHSSTHCLSLSRKSIPAMEIYSRRGMSN